MDWAEAPGSAGVLCLVGAILLILERIRNACIPCRAGAHRSSGGWALIRILRHRLMKHCGNLWWYIGIDRIDQL